MRLPHCQISIKKPLHWSEPKPPWKAASTSLMIPPNNKVKHQTRTPFFSTCKSTYHRPLASQLSAEEPLSILNIPTIEILRQSRQFCSPSTKDCPLKIENITLPLKLTPKDIATHVRIVVHSTSMHGSGQQTLSATTLLNQAWSLT